MSNLKYSSISNSSTPTDLQITILGKGVVGKSSLTYRFMNSDIPNAHDPTIEDRFKTTLSINGQEITIDILDTAGEEDYQNMFDNYLKNVDGVLLVYDITNYDTFKKIDYWNNQIKNYNKNKYSIVLIGNKIDLNNERTIQFKDAKNLAKKWGVDYIETSAKNNYNCKEALELIVKKYYNNNENEKKKSCRCFCCEIY